VSAGLSSGDSAARKGQVLPPGAIVPKHGSGYLKPFEKGKSGNPLGTATSEYHEARKICAQHSVEAVTRQLQLMRSDDERVAFMATEAILNRGIGKPRDHSTEDQARTIVNLDNLSDDERALLAKLMGKVLPKDAP
jgi:hypothetical protein